MDPKHPIAAPVYANLFGRWGQLGRLEHRARHPPAGQQRHGTCRSDVPEWRKRVGRVRFANRRTRSRHVISASDSVAPVLYARRGDVALACALASTSALRGQARCEARDAFDALLRPSPADTGRLGSATLAQTGFRMGAERSLTGPAMNVGMTRGAGPVMALARARLHQRAARCPLHVVMGAALTLCCVLHRQNGRLCSAYF